MATRDLAKPAIAPDLPIVDAHHHLWLQPEAALVAMDSMLQAVPGCYVLLGAGKSGENPGLHSSRQ